ncbi:MAG: hypothetical protein AMXMBFR58_00610 [Phycisphaerae bacterium]|nr:Carbon storage regulator [Phycisphaerales bacterium]
MLVLSRLRDETIMIGDDIEVTVVDIRGDKVRLGINAPTRIAVHRKEVYEAIKRENQQAARVDQAAAGALRDAARSVTPQRSKNTGAGRLCVVPVAPQTATPPAVGRRELDPMAPVA